MKTKLLVFIVIAVASLSLGHRAKAQDFPSKSTQIVIGEVDSLYSYVLGEQREIWVHLPDNMESGDRYPVIYLLGSTSNFYAVVGMLKLLTRWNMPESILIGIIAGENGLRDQTPTNVPVDRGQNSESSGGASDFAKFINEELQPYINGKYPTEDMTTIVGHSIGGLFVVYAYVHHPGVFDNYLAIEPSLWWDQELLVSESAAVLSTGDYGNESLYVAVANSVGIDTVAVRDHTSEETEQLRANLNFHDVLVKNKNRLEYEWEYFGNDDHSSLIVPALYNGFRQLFSWYPFAEMWRFNTPDKYTAEELVQPFYHHFSELSKRFKREMRPDWQFVNDVGLFMYSGHKSPEKAIAYLDMNLKYYPGDVRSYVALGDLHSTLGNAAKAIGYFEKAVEMGGEADIIDKLNKLRSGK